MTKTDLADFARQIARLKSRILEERSRIGDLNELLQQQVEREAGIWEYGFEELEAELWRRFAQLEENQDCTSEDANLPPGRVRAALVRRLKNIYRGLTGPLSRAVMDKEKQFNLDQQSLLNRESVPFYLALILTLQKIKDRLNALEESVDRIQKEQEEQYRGLQSLGQASARGASKK